jgi:hypothetical protein
MLRVWPNWKIKFSAHSGLLVLCWAGRQAGAVVVPPYRCGQPQCTTCIQYIEQRWASIRMHHPFASTCCTHTCSGQTLALHSGAPSIVLACCAGRLCLPLRGLNITTCAHDIRSLKRHHALHLLLQYKCTCMQFHQIVCAINAWTTGRQCPTGPD